MVKRKYVIVILIFWAVLLLSFIASKQLILDRGIDVILKTAPVDPRDLFRGDYVILRYDISTIRLDSIVVNDENFQINNDVYIMLGVDGGSHARAVEISKNKFTSGLFITGIVTNVDTSEVEVKYGIESYFVPQGEGRDIENQRGKLDVIVSINNQGKAVIKSLKE